MKDKINYGIYDRPGPTDDDTIGEETPVNVSDHMSNQLSVERPPIEDEDYVPSSVEELSRAAKALGSLVPSSQVEFFYREVHRALDKATDQENSGLKKAEDESSDRQEAGENKEVKEQVSRIVKKALFEMLSKDDVDELDDYRGRSYDTGGVDYFGDGPDSPSSSADVKTKSDGTVSLDQIAAQFGYSGASGIRQEIKRLTDRLKYFVTKVGQEDLDGLVDYAAGEYVDTLASNDLMTRDDANLMLSNMSKLKESNAFKFFFVSSFIMPAYREVARNATRKLRDGIEKLGVPADLHTTVFNQVTGASSTGTIAKKLASMVKSGKIEKQEALDLVRRIESSIPALKNSAEKDEDLIQKSLDKWQSTSKNKRKAALLQALEQQESFESEKNPEPNA